MSISRQNLSIVIVTLKSENVINQCIESIDREIPITVIENSNNLKFKKYLEKTYNNVKCILSNKNLGMGSGNNVGIEHSKTDYVLILNPDVILENNTINELIEASKIINDFEILSPISNDKDYPNYKFQNDNKQDFEMNLPFKVKSVDGFAMLLNKKKLDIIINNESLNINKKYFDESFFMYLENDDLCKRITKNMGKIYVAPKASIEHLGAKAVDSKYLDEVEYSRNWHWIWSKFYFNKKHFGFLKAFIDGAPKFFLTIFKYLFYLVINNKNKKKIYLNRISGFYHALIGNPSWYRPNLDD